MEHPQNKAWKAVERFPQFYLRAAHLSLLPAAHSLVVDTLFETIALVNWQDAQFLEVIEVAEDEQFAMMLTLLERWPSYVPYETLLRQLGIQLTGQDIEDLERTRTSGRTDEPEEEQVQNRLAQERIRPLLQTIRDLLQDCRRSLQVIGIDIVAVMDYGPLLTRYVDKEARTTQVKEGTR